MQQVSLHSLAPALVLVRMRVANSAGRESKETYSFPVVYFVTCTIDRTRIPDTDSVVGQGIQDGRRADRGDDC